MTARNIPRLMALGMFVLLFLMMIKVAWLGDDSFITFRVIDNLINGYGLRWNIAERVQTFTHPLWLFVVSFFYFFTRELYYTVIILSLLLSCWAVWLPLKKLSTSYTATTIALLALFSSKAFVDYTSSGLENPLSYLLTGLFYVHLFAQPVNRKNLRILMLLSALILLNRLDLALLLLPALCLLAWEIVYIRKALGLMSMIKDALLCFSPVWGWLLFATFYYGFPFPNTYYAKLHTGIPKQALYHQGLIYFLDTLQYDWVSMLLIALATVLAFASKELRKISAAAGIILYLLYIVSIGGDFMGGRFFSVPAYLSALLLVQFSFSSKQYLSIALFLLLSGLLQLIPTLIHKRRYGNDMARIGRTGISDERGFYYPYSGLLNVLRSENKTFIHPWGNKGLADKAKGKQVVLEKAVGFRGFYAGPEVHIVDQWALGDPLLSKLPIKAVQENTSWRIGHFERSLPAGYIASLQSGKNMIQDPQIAALYDLIQEITRDDLGSLPRIQKIIKFNIGHYDYLLERKNKPSTAPAL